MTGTSLPVAQALARIFPWETVGTVVDIGTAQGCVPVQLARSHQHLSGGGFDLPPVEPIFSRYIAEYSCQKDYASYRAISLPMICHALTYW
jgi:hypothetical protein